MATTKPRRRQRAPQEVEEALVEVARELFDEKGYQSTTTMEIAKRAEVSERLIFSKFGSKAGLFSTVVIAPFTDVVNGYIDGWITDAHGSTADERIDYLVDGLYRLAFGHRKALLKTLAENTDGPSVQQHMLDQLARAFQRMIEIDPKGEFQGLDAPAAISAVVGMIFGVALLDDLIYPSDIPRPSHQRLVEEMRNTLLSGLRDRP